MKLKKRVYAIILVIAVLTQTCSAFADIIPGVPLGEKYSGYIGNTELEKYVNTSNVAYYSTKLALYEANGYKDATKDVDVDLKSLVNSEDNKKVSLQTYEGKSGVFVWDKEINKIKFNVTVSEDALYQIETEYYMVQGESSTGVRSIYVDGEAPFTESANVFFPRSFTDDGEPVINNIGDETRPKQKEIPGWQTIRFVDTTGLVTLPFKFYLTKGTHTIELEYIDQDIAFSRISMVQPYNPPTYEEVKSEYAQKGYTQVSSAATLTFEAETEAVAKSDPTLRRENSGDPTVTPRSLDRRVLNTIGGARWKTGSQSITWKFDAPETGLYKIAIRACQNYNDGMPSYRQIAIDGQIPFEELEQYAFPYSTKWVLEELQNDAGEVFEFYLPQGEHTITMTVKYGPMTYVMESLNDDFILLSKMLTDMGRITGSDPDPNYDYKFFDTIPTLKADMETLMTSLKAKYSYVLEISGNKPAMANNFLTITAQLQSMIDDPYSIAGRIGDMNSALTNLGNWYQSIQNQPLMVDYFKVGAPSENWPDPQANVFQKAYTMFMNFLASFTKDYDNVGSVLSENVEVKETIEVWVARGTEWAEIIKEMADEDFTPNSNIAIKMNVVPASQLSAGNVNAIMLSITSGRAPDVAIGINSASPVDFAIRDAVYDLSQFPDWEDIEKRFISEVITPYKYEGGIYAIPETMDFNVLFYRKDIMADLGLTVPNTWEEFYKYVLPVLYQNGYEFSYSKDFTQILFQHGGEFYTEDGYFSALDTAEAYKAFVEYCELYTSYGVPQVADFYNRIRAGSMPLGVGNFTLYMKLSVAAPELAGKWGIAPLLGTVNENGEVDRSAGALTGEGSIILKQSDKPDAAWEFLKWWTSEEVQIQFGRELEALQGAAARWNTANLNAFTSLEWKQADLDVIKEQWRWAKETPNVLGGYFTSRYVNNAWTTVVLSGGDPRDALEAAVKAINRELKMKQEEYGIFVNE